MRGSTLALDVVEFREYALISVASKRLSNVFERDARETGVKTRDGVTSRLGEAGSREATRDVQLLLYRVRIMRRREVEGLGDSVARSDLEHVEWGLLG